jgi:nucleoid-associated protein YgaU
MERVALIVEHTGVRLGCLLNPEQLLLRRTAGVRRRGAATGALTGAALRDQPVLYTGGGTTELQLDLLFDVGVAGSTIASADVRAYTQPIWELAENHVGPDGGAEPPVVRFVWGKAWNFPGVVAAVAERLEYFTDGGVPRRSWLRLRLLRVHEAAVDAVRAPSLGGAIVAPIASVDGLEAAAGDRAVEIIGGAGPDADAGGTPSRLDQIAWRFTGDASLWKTIATLNDVADPLRLAAGQLLRIPGRLRRQEAP